MNLVDWLMDGDVAVQCQVSRDLLNRPRPDLQQRIPSQGYAKRLLDLQQEDGHWGGGYYRRKWISTHYTLMLLRRLECPVTPGIAKAIDNILSEHHTDDNGTKALRWTIRDICMNGMLLHAFCHFETPQDRLCRIVDYILTQQLPDGGYNCSHGRKGVVVKHSSLHSTLSMIEGFTTYIDNGYTYRVDELKAQRERAVEFLLMHRLYKSDRTGQVIRKQFTMLSFPPRWYYDILKALDALREAAVPYDPRMDDALDLLVTKRRKDGTWPVQQKYAGEVYFDLEPTGGPSRINTLRALRVLRYYRPDWYLAEIRER